MDSLKATVRRFINYELVLDFLDRFVFLYKHMGSNDAYPPLHYLRKNKQFFSRNFSLKSETRIKFWSFLAKKYPTFKHYYPILNDDSFISKIENEGGIYKKQLLEFYKNGVAEIENFFTKDEHEIILREFQRNIDINFKDQSGSFGHKIKNKMINKLIHNKIKPLEKIIFNKTQSKQKYIASAHLIKNSISPYKSSVHFHLDRFIPSFKFIYFPSEVSSNPFEYYAGSHKIDQDYYENVKLSQSDIDENIKDDYLLKQYKKCSFYSKANTLVIAAVHGLHRRKPETINGVRRFITISYYNTFTRYDLILNYIKSLIIYEKN